jgi:hypothetical protein
MSTFLTNTSLTAASLTSTYGPYIFPLYFAFDLTQAYLFIAVPFMSSEFLILLVTKEFITVFRNVGGNEIFLWLANSILGAKRPFPLREIHLMDKLNTNAAADTVAEVMAVSTLLFFLLGAKISRKTEGYACLFQPRSLSCGEKEYKLGEAMITIIVVVFSRLIIFFIEKVFLLAFVAEYQKRSSSPSSTPSPSSSLRKISPSKVSRSFEEKEATRDSDDASSNVSVRLSALNSLITPQVSSMRKALTNIDTGAEYGKVFRGNDPLYLVSATILTTAMVCTLGRNQALHFENEQFWDTKNGTGLAQFGDSVTANCSGVQFAGNP